MMVSVLGTEYTIEYKDSHTDPILERNDGYCDSSQRLIVIANIEKRSEVKNPEKIKKRILRHEIIHAFMSESGLEDDWEHKEFGQEETVVDWFAIQFPKLLEAFKEVNAL